MRRAIAYNRSTAPPASTLKASRSPRRARSTSSVCTLRSLRGATDLVAYTVRRSVKGLGSKLAGGRRRLQCLSPRRPLSRSSSLADVHGSDGLHPRVHAAGGPGHRHPLCDRAGAQCAGGVGDSLSSAALSRLPRGYPDRMSPTDLSAVRWIHGAADCHHSTDPPIQVVEYDADTFVLRQSKCVDFEAPFMYLLFATDTA